MDQRSKYNRVFLDRAEQLVTAFVEGKLSAQGLIEGIVSSSELREKVSYAYDPRFAQNSLVGPVQSTPSGRFIARKAYRRT